VEKTAFSRLNQHNLPNSDFGKILKTSELKDGVGIRGGCLNVDHLVR